MMNSPLCRGDIREPGGVYVFPILLLFLIVLTSAYELATFNSSLLNELGPEEVSYRRGTKRNRFRR